MRPMSEARVLDGRYRLVREIASGGMGVVYEAEHIALKKRVALKLLRPDIADLPGVAARFEREARATSLLDDPNIVRVTDFGRTPEGELYLVMELLQGRPLTSLLAETPQLEIEHALFLVDQMLSGLQVAHSHGLIHRDLKPDNIFVSPSPRGELVRVPIIRTWRDWPPACFLGNEPSVKIVWLNFSVFGAALAYLFLWAIYDKRYSWYDKKTLDEPGGKGAFDALNVRDVD